MSKVLLLAKCRLLFRTTSRNVKNSIPLVRKFSQKLFSKHDWQIFVVNYVLIFSCCDSPGFLEVNQLKEDYSKDPITRHLDKANI